MVVNTNKILDEGQNKYVAEVIQMDEISKMDKAVRHSQKQTFTPDPVWDSDDEDWIQGNERENPDYKPPNGIIRKWLEADDILMNPLIAKDMKQKMLADPIQRKALYKFFGWIPFNPCVMINISPAWKDDVDPKDEKAQELLADTIQTYFNSCNRYSKYRYALECGGEGNFLHAHIVAEINPDLNKSVKTHINKGNHKYEIMKHWDKILMDLPFDYNKFKSGKEKGSEGLLKGKYSVQRIMLNNETLRDDKLKYLIEENKPEGHKNKYDMDMVLGDF